MSDTDSTQDVSPETQADQDLAVAGADDDGQAEEPPDLAAEQAEAEARRRLFSAPITFMLGVTSQSALPVPDVPEIAFAGRSNVGKSSIINAVTNRKALARTSNTPGRTREINFFDLDGRLRIVDLPGYGYASAPKPTVRQWTNLMFDYLRGRVNLARVFVLIDSRHGIKKTDDAILDALDQAAVSYQGVLTKVDKLKPSERDQVLDATIERLKTRPAAYPEVLRTSSETGEGIDTLGNRIASLSLPRSTDRPEEPSSAP